jgi:hypothetical protein
MSTSTFVVGIMPADENYRKMKNVYDACTDAGIQVPNEVHAFFRGEKPDAAGMTVDLDSYGANIARNWSDEHYEGYEIDVACIPTGVKTIRFYWG